MRYRLLETLCRLRFRHRHRHRLPAVEFKDNRLLSLSSSLLLSPSSLPSSSSEDGGNNNNYDELRNEAQDLIERASLKIYGSLQHTKLRRTHTNVFCDTVRAGLREKIQMRYKDNGDGVSDDNVSAAAAADAATKKLEADLGGIGADQGIMPDFSNKEALHGYTLNHFGRVRLTSELVTAKSLSEPDWLSFRVSELLSSSSSSSSSSQHRNNSNNNNTESYDDLSIASLGGGCGYDFVAFSALSEFLKGPRIKTTVYEYEPAWKHIVSDVEMIVQDSCSSSNNNNSGSASGSGQQPRDHHQHLHKCGFEFGDITSPLDASTNEAIASMVNSTEIFSCSYVIAENAVKLQQNKFEFFRQLFSEAADGSLFFFTETTHRLWPDLIDLASRQDDNNSFMRYTIPHLRSGKVGWQLALLKDSTTAGNISFSSKSCDKSEEVRVVEKELIERFKKDNLAHQLRIDRGWKRDEKKVRGAK
jgi:hypothetical protein